MKTVFECKSLTKLFFEGEQISEFPLMEYLSAIFEHKSINALESSRHGKIVCWRMFEAKLNFKLGYRDQAITVLHQALTDSSLTFKRFQWLDMRLYLCNLVKESNETDAIRMFESISDELKLLYNY